MKYHLSTLVAAILLYGCAQAAPDPHYCAKYPAKVSKLRACNTSRAFCSAYLGGPGSFTKTSVVIENAPQSRTTTTTTPVLVETSYTATTQVAGTSTESVYTDTTTHITTVATACARIVNKRAQPGPSCGLGKNRDPEQVSGACQCILASSTVSTKTVTEGGTTVSTILTTAEPTTTTVTTISTLTTTPTTTIFTTTSTIAACTTCPTFALKGIPLSDPSSSYGFLKITEPQSYFSLLESDVTLSGATLFTISPSARLTYTRAGVAKIGFVSLQTYPGPYTLVYFDTEANIDNFNTDHPNNPFYRLTCSLSGGDLACSTVGARHIFGGRPYSDPDGDDDPTLQLFIGDDTGPVEGEALLRLFAVCPA